MLKIDFRSSTVSEARNFINVYSLMKCIICTQACPIVSRLWNPFSVSDFILMNSATRESSRALKVSLFPRKSSSRREIISSSVSMVRSFFLTANRMNCLKVLPYFLRDSFSRSWKYPLGFPSSNELTASRSWCLIFFFFFFWFGGLSRKRRFCRKEKC